MAKALKTIGVIAGVAALAATGVGAFAVAGSALAATAASVASYATLVGTAASIAARSAAGKPRAEGSQSSFMIGANNPLPYLLGEAYTEGVEIYRTGWGGKIDKTQNPYAFIPRVLSCCGPIQSMGATFVNHEAVTLSGSVGSVQAATGYHGGFLWADQQLGARPEADALAPPAGWGMPPQWSPSHKLSGMAAVGWSLKWDKEGAHFSGGQVPPLGKVPQGVKVYDPRLDSTFPGGSGSHRITDESTWEYSRNPALHALAYAYGRRVNGVPVFGGRFFDADAVDVADVVPWANVCDVNGWTVNGTIFEPGDKWNNLKRICEAGGARPVLRGGVLGFDFTAPRASLATITRDDLVAAPVSGRLGRGWKNRHNTLVPRFRSPAHQWTYQQAEAVEVASFLAADGEEKTDERQFDLVTDVDQVTELTMYDLWDRREAGPFVLPCKPHCRVFWPGDCLILSAGLGVHPNGAVKAIVTRRTVDSESGIVQLELEQETDYKHVAALGLAGAVAVSAVLPDTAAFDEAWWVNANEEGKLFGIEAGATRNDDGLNMLSNSQDPATWTFANGAVAINQTSGYAGLPNGWYAQLQSANALARFSDYVPVTGGEALYFSYVVASDHPVGAPSGQTVNASYSYQRHDGTFAAVNLSAGSARDLAQMGSGTVVTVKFTVPLDAVRLLPYVERPVFTSYTAFVRAGAYLGRAEPGATSNVVTYSATEPAGAREGDLWVDTSGTFAVFKLRSGGAWVTGANALSAYNALSGKPIALADINTTESSKLIGIADKATRNDDGLNMLPNSNDPAMWSFGGGAVAVNQTSGYAGLPNGWYAQLQSSGASVRFSGLVPVTGGETLYLSYTIASDHPGGPASGQTVNASYVYQRHDGSTVAVYLPDTVRDLAQMGTGIVVTAKFTVPLDAVKVQPYVERPAFTSYTAFVRAGAYLGRAAPGATDNSGTINDDGSIKDGKVGTGALLASAVTTKSSAYTGGGLLITPGGYVFVTVQQLTLTGSGEPIHLIFSHAYYAIDNAKVKVQVWRDGTLLVTLNERNVSGGDNGSECQVFTDTPGAGTFTYYVKVGSNDNGDTTVYNRSLFALELKR